MVRKTSERGRIDVVVRKRPLNELEMSRGEKDIVICNYDSGTIREFKCKIDGTNFIEEHEFKVDRFYDEKADNELIYNEYVKPLVECAFWEKKTCSCFTYGQTGSGKTYTMIGSRIPKRYYDSECKVVAGIYEYAANDIYRILKEPEFEGKIDVVISFYEIYCGKLYDLLQNRKLLESLDNGKKEVVIRDLSVRTVTSKEDLVEHMLEGLNLRKIGQNSQNDHSSRSHALLRIELKNKENGKFQGGIIFIDLAGSERGADSINMCKQMQIDGAGINRSLLALKECIRAMDMDKIHIPFRNSELTKVLRDVFMGGSRNVMIANICPSFQSCEQTLNTLRYASRVKNFKSNSNNNNTNNNYNNGLSSFNTFDSISTDCNGYSHLNSMDNTTNLDNTNKDTNNTSNRIYKTRSTSYFKKNVDSSSNSSNNDSNTSKDTSNTTSSTNIDVNKNNNYTRFISLPITRYNSSKYQQYSKSPDVISKLVKENNRKISLRYSNSSIDYEYESKKYSDKMDIDVVDNILKSLSESTISNLKLIVDSLELNELYSNIYQLIINGSKIPDVDYKENVMEDLELNENEDLDENKTNGDVVVGSKDNENIDSSNTNEDNKDINEDEILKVYDLYSKVNSMLNMLRISEDMVEDINNKFTIQLKILLYLKQVLDKIRNIDE